MVDEVLITRDPQGATDDEYDESTMELTPAPGDLETIYTGKCMFAFEAEISNEMVEGGQDVYELPYGLYLPKDAPVLQDWDKVTVTHCERDATQEGLEMWVEEPNVGSTFSVMRIVRTTTRDKRLYL